MVKGCKSKRERGSQGSSRKERYRSSQKEEGKGAETIKPGDGAEVMG